MMLLAAVVCLVVVMIGYAEAEAERVMLSRHGNRRGAIVAGFAQFVLLLIVIVLVATIVALAGR